MATKPAQKEPLVPVEIQVVIDGKNQADTPPPSGNKRMLDKPVIAPHKPEKVG